MQHTVAKFCDRLCKTCFQNKHTSSTRK